MARYDIQPLTKKQASAKQIRREAYTTKIYTRIVFTNLFVLSTDDMYKFDD